MTANVISPYLDQMDKLVEIIDRTNDRIIADNPDPIFIENINFFTKSYLINLCAIAEACLKETAMNLVKEMSKKVASANVTKNIVYWSIYKDAFDEKKHSKFESFSLDIDEKEVSDKLSANPWRAMKLFKLVGCDIQQDSDFDEVKGIVGSVVEKRNNIVHHNDDANDISLSDVKTYVAYFRTYLSSVSKSAQRLVD